MTSSSNVQFIFTTIICFVYGVNICPDKSFSIISPAQNEMLTTCYRLATVKQFFLASLDDCHTHFGSLFFAQSLEQISELVNSSILKPTLSNNIWYDIVYHPNDMKYYFANNSVVDNWRQQPWGIGQPNPAVIKATTKMAMVRPGLNPSKLMSIQFTTQDGGHEQYDDDYYIQKEVFGDSGYKTYNGKYDEYNDKSDYGKIAEENTAESYDGKEGLESEYYREVKPEYEAYTNYLCTQLNSDTDSALGFSLSLVDCFRDGYMLCIAESVNYTVKDTNAKPKPTSKPSYSYNMENYDGNIGEKRYASETDTKEKPKPNALKSDCGQLNDGTAAMIALSLLGVLNYYIG